MSEGETRWEVHVPRVARSRITPLLPYTTVSTMCGFENKILHWNRLSRCCFKIDY